MYQTGSLFPNTRNKRTQGLFPQLSTPPRYGFSRPTSVMGINRDSSEASFSNFGRSSRSHSVFFPVPVQPFPGANDRDRCLCDCCSGLCCEGSEGCCSCMCTQGFPTCEGFQVTNPSVILVLAALLHVAIVVVLASVEGFSTMVSFSDEYFETEFGDLVIWATVRFIIAAFLIPSRCVSILKGLIYLYDVLDILYTVVKMTLFRYSAIDHDVERALIIYYLPAVVIQAAVSFYFLRRFSDDSEHVRLDSGSSRNYGILSSNAQAQGSYEKPRFYSPNRYSINASPIKPNPPNQRAPQVVNPPLFSDARNVANEGVPSSKLPTKPKATKQVTFPLPETPPASIPKLPLLGDQISRQLLSLHHEECPSDPIWTLAYESSISQTFVKYAHLLGNDGSVPNTPDKLSYSSFNDDIHPIVRTISHIDYAPKDLNNLIFESRLDWDPLVGIPDGDKKIIQEIQTVDENTTIMRLRFEINTSIFPFGSNESKDFFIIRRWATCADTGRFYYVQCSIPGFGSIKQKMAEPLIHLSGLIIEPVPAENRDGQEKSCVTFIHQLTLGLPTPKTRNEKKIIHLPIHLKALHKLRAGKDFSSISVPSANPSPINPKHRSRQTSGEFDHVETRIYRTYVIQPDHFSCEPKKRIPDLASNQVYAPPPVEPSIFCEKTKRASREAVDDVVTETTLGIQPTQNPPPLRSTLFDGLNEPARTTDAASGVGFIAQQQITRPLIPPTVQRLPYAKPNLPRQNLPPIIPVPTVNRMPAPGRPVRRALFANEEPAKPDAAPQQNTDAVAENVPFMTPTQNAPVMKE